MPHRHLPPLLETLARYELDPQQVYWALEEYEQLATELILEQSPPLEPYAFLQLRDERDAVYALLKLFQQQSPHLMLKSDREEEQAF